MNLWRSMLEMLQAGHFALSLIDQCPCPTNQHNYIPTSKLNYMVLAAFIGIVFFFVEIKGPRFGKGH